MTMMWVDEEQFGKALQQVLSPSRAIQTPELLKGRDRQLQDIRQAWYISGRQVFIYGYRGVGKTSLAHTAAFQHQPADSEPVLLTCSEGATFCDLVHDMVSRGLQGDPRETKRTRTKGLAASIGRLSGELRDSVESGKIPLPKSLNEALELTDFFARAHSEPPVVIIDEFDLLKNKKEQASFATFIKQIGDQGIGVKFIMCGIGETLDELLHAHESTYRYFHTVRLDRLDFDPRCEIITNAAQKLRVHVDDTTKYRIAKISDGFPHFIHLLCEKLFWVVFRDQNASLRVTGDHYETALGEAVLAIEPHLKKPYEKATRKYSNDYEPVLWAVADDHQLQRPTKEILQSYMRIMGALGRQPLAKTQFYGRMNNMKKPAHGEILIGTRAGWYEFREKMLRGYARLRASQAGVELDIEHPMQGRRFKAAASELL